MAKEDLRVKQRIEGAIKSNEIPHLYLNGFTASVGTGDVLFVLEQNGQPVATLNMSFTLGKTLVNKLNGLIQNLETKTSNKIMTVETVEKALTS